MYLNGSPIVQTLWVYGVHSQNPELIDLFEKYKIYPANKCFEECFFESLKCHHIEMSNYLVENFLNNQICDEVYIQSLKYYNYLFFPNELDQIADSFLDLCKYDYPSIVKLLLQARSFDINAQMNSWLDFEGIQSLQIAIFRVHWYLQDFPESFLH